VTAPEEQIELLREICPGAQLFDEAGGKVAYMPGFEWPHLTVEQKMDLLLIPFPHSGYDNRLFFDHQLPPGRNPSQPVWTQQSAIGRTWMAPSVREIANSRPWREMVAAFLRVIG
jgi:hypothetical protein